MMLLLLFEHAAYVVLLLQRPRTTSNSSCARSCGWLRGNYGLRIELLLLRSLCYESGLLDATPA